MDAFPVQVLPDLFVGTLLLLASALLAGRVRRFPANALLALFLALVGCNFLAGALGGLSGERAWQQVAYVALALDPIFLVAFVCAHPYPRWTPLRVAVLAWLGLVAAVSIPIVLWRPEWVIAWTFGAPLGSPARWLLLVGGLGAGYAAAWFIAIQSVREAPTSGLAQRALWAALAVGVAVLPRLPLLTGELALLRPGWLSLGQHVSGGEIPAWALAHLAVQVAVSLALLAPAIRRLRTARTPSQQTRRFLRALGGIVLGLLALQAALGVYVLSDPTHAAFPSLPFNFRWIIFASILAYAVSVHQVLPLPDSNRAALPLAGGLVTAIAAALVALPSATGALGSGLAAGIVLAVGAAAFPLGMRLTRRALRGAERLPTGYADLERRLVLYRAALESAWARGRPAPEATQRLNRLRLEFGLSREEAKVLEHVVRDSLRQAEQDLVPGQEAFPGVVVDEVLGAGSQGRTYLARTLPAGDRVVVKQVHAASSPEARKRLRGELHALGQVRHPSLPQLLDFALEPSPRLLYTFVDGQPLSGLLRSGPIPEPQARRLAAALGDALEHIHGRGIVHGDVKPENILIDGQGHAVLIDFGLAHDAADLRGTIAGLDGWRIAGTLAYMAPERAAGAPAGTASDWYALGMTLAEALTGRPRRRVNGLPLHRALESLREPVDLADVPAGWRPLLEGLLEANPRRRLRDVRRLLAALAEGPAAPAAASPSGSELRDQEGAAGANHVP